MSFVIFNSYVTNDQRVDRLNHIAMGIVEQIRMFAVKKRDYFTVKGCDLSNGNGVIMRSSRFGIGFVQEN